MVLKIGAFYFLFLLICSVQPLYDVFCVWNPVSVEERLQFIWMCINIYIWADHLDLINCWERNRYVCNMVLFILTWMSKLIKMPVSPCLACFHVGVKFIDVYRYVRWALPKTFQQSRFCVDRKYMSSWLETTQLWWFCYLFFFSFFPPSISLRELKTVLPQVNFKVSSMKYLKDKFAVIISLL